MHECDRIFNVTRGDDIMLTMGTDFTVRLSFLWSRSNTFDLGWCRTIVHAKQSVHAGVLMWQARLL